MLRYRIVAYIGLAATLALIYVAGAKAAPFTPRMDLAYAIAIKYYGGEPSLCTSIDKQVVGSEELKQIGQKESYLYGWATIPNEKPIACQLYIDRKLADHWYFQYLCETMIHEVGHNHGLYHDDDPNSVMNPVRTISLPICEGYALRVFRLANYRHEWQQRIKYTKPSVKYSFLTRWRQASHSLWNLD